MLKLILIARVGYYGRIFILDFSQGDAFEKYFKKNKQNGADHSNNNSIKELHRKYDEYFDLIHLPPPLYGGGF